MFRFFPVRAVLVLAMTASSQAATLVSIPVNPSGGTPSSPFVVVQEATILSLNSLASVPEPHTLPFGVIGMTLLLLRRRTR